MGKNKPQIYLHIGTPKTGTSTIQFYLSKYREKILNKYGIYYPNTYEDTVAHYRYVHIFDSQLPLYQKLIKKYKSSGELYNELFEEILSVNCDKVILSCEDFIHIEPKILKEIFNDWNVNLILYIRRQDIFLESSVLQIIKQDIPYIHFINPFGFYSEKLFKYVNLINRWKECFPTGKFYIRLYKRDWDKSWDVLEDFLSVFGIEKEENLKLEKNPSLSPISFYALAKIKERYKLEPQELSKVVEFLINLDREDPPVKKTLLNLEERMSLLEYLKEDNEKLFSEILREDNKFVLREEEIEFYEKQDRVPNEVIEAQVQERLQKTIKFLEDLGCKFIPNTEFYLFERYGYLNPLLKSQILNGKVKEGVLGYIDKIDKNGISGWLIDLSNSEPDEFIIKINDRIVYEGKATIMRKDIIEITGINKSTGFSIKWEQINIPKEVLELISNTDVEVKVIHKKSGGILNNGVKKINLSEVLKEKTFLVGIPYVVYTGDGKELVEFVNVDQLLIDVLREERLIIGGLVVLRKGVKQEDFRLWCRDAEGEKEVQWGLPSPGYASAHPDNPNAKNARFRVEGVKLINKVEVFLYNIKLLEVRK